jgi:hypothetical protein
MWASQLTLINMSVLVISGLVVSVISFVIALICLFMFIHVYMLNEQIYGRYFPHFVREFRHQDGGDLHRRLTALEIEIEAVRTWRHSPDYHSPDYHHNYRSRRRPTRMRRVHFVDDDTNSSSTNSSPTETVLSGSTEPLIGDSNSDLLSTELSNTFAQFSGNATTQDHSSI